MRINTNLSALSAQRSLWSTQNKINSSMQKLSSGFRINRAADDAAGLGIANKLRAENRALKQASRNAEQGNAMLQVMEGATQSIGNILERMKELATQAASDNTDDLGRDRLDAEYQELLAEIDRIVDTTKFQDQTLLDGSFGDRKVFDAATSTFDGVTGIESIGVSSEATAEQYNVTIDTTNNLMTVTGATSGEVETVAYSADSGAQTIEFNGLGLTIKTNANWTETTALTTSNNLIEVDNDTSASAQFLVSSSGQYTDNDLLSIDGIDLQASALGLGSDLQSVANSQSVLTNVDTAIDTLNASLGQIGAAQNRIDFAIQNVKVAIENYSAAESTIRDVDMAAEMTEFSKQQILSQAGTAMLAQANQISQGVLQLLRG